MDAPQLVIPVRLDIDKAIAQLQKMGAESSKAGAAGKKAGKDTEEGYAGVTPAVSRASDAIAGMMTVQMAIGAYRSVVAGISEEYKRQADYVKQLAKEFVDLRQAMQQVAALKGEQNDNPFTVEQTRQAAAASLTPQAWTNFQEQFQSYGGAYIEGDQSRFKGQAAMTAQELAAQHPGSKATDFKDQEAMTPQQQAEKYQKDIAKFAQAKIGPQGAAQAAELAGGLLQFSKGPQSVDSFEQQFAKVYKTLERAPTPAPELMTAMPRVMAQGASPEEASQMLAIMSEGAGHEEEVHVRSALRAIREKIREGKGAELGQKEGMTPLEQVKAAAETIKKQVDGGKKLEDVLANVASDERERKGLGVFVTRGVEAGGFDRVKSYQAEATPETFGKALADYDRSDAGKRAKVRADFALARVEKGARLEPIDLELEKSKTDLEKTDYGEKTHYLENTVRRTVGWEDPEQQRINEMTLSRLRTQARGAGISDEQRATFDSGSTGLSPQFQVNQDIKALLEKIKESNDRIADAAKNSGGKAPGAAQDNRPLVAPPGGNNNRPIRQ